MALMGIPQAPAGSDGLHGVYWVGQDGNIYAKGNGANSGVYNAGKAIKTIQNGFDSSLGSTESFRQIADPNPGNPSAAGNNAAASGVSYATAPGSAPRAAAPVYPDKSNDISMQQAGLGAAGSSRDTGIGSITDAFNKIMGEYTTDENNAQTEYGNESDANQKDLQTNKQTALETGQQGRQGLFGTLASLGALNGTGIDLANHAVQQGTNEDLTKSADTYATNQNALDSGYNAFKRQDETRKAQATAAESNDINRVKNNFFRAQQQYLTNIANDYQDEGKTAQAKDYAAQAAALFPSIASSDVPAIDIGYSGSAYTAPTLQSYLGSANNTTVQSTPASGGNSNVLSIPGLIALNKRQS